MYGVKFQYNAFFSKGTNYLLGKFNNVPISCYAKSGGQNLWLPFLENVGLKVFHPQGFSGTLEKARIHYEDQSLLAEQKISPKPIEMFEINLNFVEVCDMPFAWKCYGIMMERVLSGGINPILKNLELFGVEHISQSLWGRTVRAIIKEWVSWYGSDALTLADYMLLCRFFRVLEDKYLKEIMDGLKGRMPPNFINAPDLLSWPNVVLNEYGEAKVVDCDLSR